MSFIVRALDANGDWTFGKGDNDYKSNSDAVAQDIQTRLSSFLGDCFFDLGAGIDWFNLLGSKNQVGLALAVNAVILNTAYVKRVLQLSVTLLSSRRVTISYVVETVFTGFTAADQITIQNNSNFLLTESGLILQTESGEGILI